jgi:alkylation response protein AidB-like acyl-CoA dehydrogenase
MLQRRWLDPYNAMHNAQSFLAPSTKDRFLLLILNDDEIGIIEAASTFLEGVIPLARLHRRDASADLSGEALRQCAELGWFGIAVPTELGGNGLSSVEHVLFFREVGRRCGPLDLLAQSLAAMVTSDRATRTALLEGRQSAVLAVSDGDELRVLGRPDAQFAVQVTAENARLIELSGTELEKRSSLDPAVSMRMMRTSEKRVIARSADLNVVRLARLGVAAMLLGVAEAALDLIVEYAKVRTTFGRPIGAYQAVRHPCADMALRAEAARCQLWFAAAAMKEGRGDVDAHIDTAKHLANEAAVTNSDVNIQLHGGIGVTDEHDAHLLLKHALLLSRLFGSKRVLLANLLEARIED